MNVIDYCRKYPEHEIQDILKFIYQSCMGCEHLVTDETGAAERIKGEALKAECTEVEELDGEYCRVHLGWINEGLKPETLAKLFIMSAKHEEAGPERIEAMLKAYGIDIDWDRKAVHHSERFRQAYSPAYRVIAKKYARLIPVFAMIDKNQGKGIIAIDGRSGSGKSTAAEALSAVYGAAVFHMDDFFLRPSQRTPQRLGEAGGNVDRERFLEEVLIPLSKGSDIEFSRFDCSTMGLKAPEKVSRTPLVIVEGSYSMHPDLREYYDMKVFLDIDEKLQMERIVARNGAVMAERFRNDWIPLEEKYFNEMKIREYCDILLDK